MSDATPAYRGYRLQTLYIIWRILEPNLRQDLIFQPEGVEDFSIWDTTDNLLEIVQVKAYGADLTLSLLSPEKVDSFLYRTHRLLAEYPNVNIKIASFGDIGSELRTATQENGRESSKVQQISGKIARYKFLAEADALRIIERLQIVRVLESNLEEQIFATLQNLCTRIDPVCAFDILNSWIYRCAENRSKISQNDLIKKINDVGKFIAERHAHHTEWFRSIVPIENKDIDDHVKERLSDEFYRGISARYDRILAGVDKPRTSKLTGLAESLFWVGWLNIPLPISDWLAHTDLDLATTTLPLEILANLILGLFYSDRQAYHAWLNTNYAILIDRFCQETRTVRWEDDGQNIMIHFVVGILQPNASISECQDSQEHDLRNLNNISVRQLELLRRFFPDRELYGSKGYGHLVLPNTELPDNTNKNIPCCNLPIQWLVSINSMFIALGEQYLRPNSWDVYTQSSVNLRQKNLQILSQINQGLEIYFRQQETIDIFGNCVDDETSFPMRLLHFRRTFVEKLFSLHSKVTQYQLDGTPFANYTRHYYDLVCLAKCPETIAMLQSEEYIDIKRDTDRISQVYFSNQYHPPQDLNFSQSNALFPTGELRQALAKPLGTRIANEYKQQCDTLCLSTYPAWEAVEQCFTELSQWL